MSTPTKPRLDKEASDARRPLSIDDQLAADHTTAHRDPGGALAGRTVSTPTDAPRAGSLLNMVNASVVSRVRNAIDGQGVGFTALRTPPWDLPKDSRGIIQAPAVELFGDARPHTAEVLDGTAAVTWGWPR